MRGVSENFLRLTAGLLLLLGEVGGAWADIERPKTPPVPVARPAQVEAVRGFTVEIPLNATTASTKVLQFILRQPPKHGRLEAPVQAGKDSAVVRYTANPASTAPVDTFTFAAKVEGSGSSEEALVTIRLIDPAPVLEAPAGIDLGRILATETVERTFVVANKGNALFKATVPLPEGWSWAAPAGGQFEIEPGNQIDAVIRIRPAEPGELDHKVTLRPGSVVRIIGRVLPPLLGYPSFLRLQWERGTANRSSRFSVRNNRGEPLTVRLSAPPGIVLPESITVPVAESVDVRISCTGDVSKALSGRIRLEAPGWLQEISYEAAQAPALVNVEGSGPGDSVDFGIAENTSVPRPARELKLRNIGGTPAVVAWDPLRFFIVEGLEPELVLAPQAERRFTVRPQPEEPGRLKEELTLHMTGGDRTLLLMAEIDAAAAKEALMAGKVLDVRPMAAPGTEGNEGAASAARTELGQRKKVGLFAGGLMEAIPNKDPNLPQVTMVRLVEEATKPDRLVFEWLAPEAGTWTYRVMVRMLRNHGKHQAPIPEYGQMDNVKVITTPTGGRAEVSKLRPGVYWKCRIVAIRSDGVSNRPSEELTFLTPLEGDSRWGWRVLGVLGAIALILYVRQKWREDVKWKD